MKIPKLLTGSFLFLTMSIPSIAHPVWEVMGKSNGGSEIALDLGTAPPRYIDGDVPPKYLPVEFQYRITKNGKTVINQGLLINCFDNPNPKGWKIFPKDSPDEGVWVPADSKASKSMAKKACQVAKSRGEIFFQKETVVPRERH
jgi:hypothetical protein